MRVEGVWLSRVSSCECWVRLRGVFSRWRLRPMCLLVCERRQDAARCVDVGVNGDTENCCQVGRGARVVAAQLEWVRKQ